jgi:hypothetical protein
VQQKLGIAPGLDPLGRHHEVEAESDAVNAVDFALAAVEEAEYAVLDAALARADADTMASSA